jgi:FMN phosphatase YigB (HAD superfamily)
MQMTKSQRIVFFDAEGTLYVPKKGRTFDDFWEGGDHTLERALENFELNQGVEETLGELMKKGHELVVVSVHKPDLLPDLLKGLGIRRCFTDILVNGDKGELMEEYLDEKDVPKDLASIVGDIYDMDIAPAEKVGIRGLLLPGPELSEFRDIIHYVD